MKSIFMHIDKLISSVALILTATAWDRVSLIAGSVLAIIMIIYYVVSTYCKIKEHNDKKKEK